MLEGARKPEDEEVFLPACDQDWQKRTVAGNATCSQSSANGAYCHAVTYPLQSLSGPSKPSASDPGPLVHALEGELRALLAPERLSWLWMSSWDAPSASFTESASSADTSPTGPTHLKAGSTAAGATTDCTVKGEVNKGENEQG